MDDERSDKEYLQDLLDSMSPVWLLKQASAGFAEYGPDYFNRDGIKGYVVAVALAQASGLAPEAKVVQMNVRAYARKKLIEANPAFQAELARIVSAGVAWRYGGDQDYIHQSRSIYFIVTFDGLEQLEELAADDAGILDKEERMAAKVMLLRWLLQNYHKDCKLYLEKWPKVERFPYDNAANNFGKEPSRVRL